MRQVVKDFVVPLAILLTLILIFWFSNLDLRIQNLFYIDGVGWVHRNANPWVFLYHYGAIPGLALGVGALIILLASFRYHALSPLRKKMIFIILTLLIGPGLIVNIVLKDNWGRPRPRQVEQFDGSEEFRRVWEIGFPDHYSFPSGHAAIGFFIFCPYFILRDRGKNWANAFLIAGLLCGSSIGLARMIQGGHFPSDVVWSGGIVYLSAAGCYYLLGLHREENQAAVQCPVSHW